MSIVSIDKRGVMEKDKSAERMAVQVQIEATEAALEFLREKLKTLGGAQAPVRQSTRYRRVKTIHAIRNILEEHGPQSIEQLTRILVDNGNEIADTTDPEGNTRRSVTKGVEHKHVQILDDGRVWLLDEPIPEESE